MTADDALNAPSLVGKLGFVEGELGLQHAMKFAQAFYGSVKRAAAALEGKSAVERLRHYAAQARADAAKKPVTPAMQLHQNLMNLIQQQRSYAPVPNRAGGPAKPAAGDKGAWAAPQPAGGQPASSSPQQRMDAMLKNLSPAQVEALNAHGAARPAPRIFRGNRQQPGFHGIPVRGNRPCIKPPSLRRTAHDTRFRRGAEIPWRNAA